MAYLLGYEIVARLRSMYFLMSPLCLKKQPEVKTCSRSFVFIQRLQLATSKPRMTQKLLNLLQAQASGDSFQRIMDHIAPTFADKTNKSKLQTNPKLNQASKICRQKRVFGAARSTNIPTRPSKDKFINKPKYVVSQKQPKSTPASVVDTAEDLGTEASEIEFRENISTGGNKKDEAFLNRETQKTSNESKEKASEEPQTPVESQFRSTTKSKLSATPFYSALRCSKCRFDKLETSSYWIAQIKLAESVDKHFVAVDFFRLAMESQAEPIRNLRIELKKYMSRHGYLSERREWREVGARYGLWKPESNTCEVDPSAENEKSISCRED